jgi:hypothetical protein
VLNERVIRHVIDILVEEHGPGLGGRDRTALEAMVRARAAQINALVAQMQAWVGTDDVEFDAIRTLLEHLPSIDLRFDQPLAIDLTLPIGEIMLAISDTGREPGEVDGLDVVPNECPDIQEPPEDGLEPFRRAFES